MQNVLGGFLLAIVSGNEATFLERVGQQAKAPKVVYRNRSLMASRIKVAAVGLGWVALHRHLPVMDRGDRFEVVGVIDRTPQRADDVASRRGYRRSACAASLAEVSWLDEVDAITVATAPMAHHALIR